MTQSMSIDEAISIAEENGFVVKKIKKYGEKITQEELDYIRNNFDSKSPVQIAKYLGRSATYIRKIMHDLGLGKNIKKEQKWTDTDIKYLKRNYGKISTKKIASKLNRSEAAVLIKVSNLRLKGKYRKNQHAHWKQKDLDYLEENYGRTLASTIAKELGRTLDSIYQKAHELGLRGNISLNRPRRWTSAETTFLSENKDSKTIDEIAEKLNRTTQSVYKKMRKIRRKK